MKMKIGLYFLGLFRTNQNRVYFKNYCRIENETSLRCRKLFQGLIFLTFQRKLII